MIKITGNPVIYDGQTVSTANDQQKALRANTMAYDILNAHNTSTDPNLFKLKVDAMASHDITYVGIIQTARASGLKEFPLPYVLTNCHNSLCAVGGTINEDDHAFGLSAAKKFGGEYVPAHMAVIHQYTREVYAGGGKMILGSDSHTRYGPLGTLGIGEGGGELAKQLLGKTYDIAPPRVVAVNFQGEINPGVGPQDIALSLIGAVFAKGIVKNAVLEFIGDGISKMSIDMRNGIDVMTTETTCLSSIWQTDEKTRHWLAVHGRENDYKQLTPNTPCYYDDFIDIELSKIRPMLALPFHPSLALPIHEFIQSPQEHLRGIGLRAQELWQLDSPPDLTDKLIDGKFTVDQAYIGGCSGGLPNNIIAAAKILNGGNTGNGDFALSVYPASVPMGVALTQELSALTAAGAMIRSAFCGPCFGAGDVPRNGGFSIRHATRNFPNREGSKSSEKQSAYVALMDARSIAATALNGGVLTAADTLPNPPVEDTGESYRFDDSSYRARVYRGVNKPNADETLRFGPNIADWPEMPALPNDIVVAVASALYDDVTTTDELIPSGETSSYRSTPLRLAEFTLSRRDPEYVKRAKAAQECSIGSVVVALRPGDGSAREQAASCQRVLGGMANIAREYATKRYRSNLINWGMLPFICTELGTESGEIQLQAGDMVEIKGVRDGLLAGQREFTAKVNCTGGNESIIKLALPNLTDDELHILLAGCLINANRA
ncbi:MAG: hydratase [Oscillospiraceae bacterium]|nr:hydratase [Oscillospiraceae bacterium]